MNYRLSAGMIMVETNDAIIFDMNKKYHQEYPEHSVLNRYTYHSNVWSRKAGILGELIFAEMYSTAILSKDWRYDFIYKGKKIDVKCKCRNVAPDIATHQASIFAYQARNKVVDIYYFMSTTKTFEKVWLCGYITKKQLLTHPFLEYWKKNAIDNSNGKQFRADTLSIGYEYLNPIDIDKINSKDYLDLGDDYWKYP